MTVVALVPAKDAADTIGATVRALGSLAAVDRVLVVDDGSRDGTAAVARAAGAEVLRLPTNRGKGGAVLAGVARCDEADILLLIDADVGATAAAADRLLAPVLAGEADLVVGILPRGSTGGLGTIRRLAAAGIRRAAGVRVEAPLSGQRAVRARLLRDLASVERFGLEVAMTIDAARSGARLREVAVPMTHRRTGRSPAGFAHRGRQGIDIARSLWPRLTSPRARSRAVVATALVAIATLAWSGGGQVSAGRPARLGVDRVVVVGVPHLGLDDLGTGAMPALDRLSEVGAAAATNVRTGSARPASAEAYATLGAGARVAADPGDAALALRVDEPYESGRAGEVVGRRMGTPAPTGAIVLPEVGAVRSSAGRHVPSLPGALGQALVDAGFDAAVVSNADSVAADGTEVIYRPAAAAVIDESGSVAAGTVAAEELLALDPAEPFGRRADVDRFLAATTAALETAELVVVDLGDMNRVAWQAHAGAAPAVTEAARARALTRVDAYVGRLVEQLDHQTLLLVVGVRPPGSAWELTPTVAYGAGVVRGSLYSPSTKREGLITLTDVAPTVLHALGVDTPDGMVGHPLRYRSEGFDRAGSQQLNELAGSRERVYKPMAVTFIVVQALVYLVAVLWLARRGSDRAASALRLVVLTFAAWPLATFVERALPGIERVGAWRQALVWVVAAGAAAVASRARRHPLAPLSWIAGVTAAVLVLDVARGAELQMASVLGYSPHTAARYVGFGNTAFAVLAACAVVLAAIHVAYAPRPREAVVRAGALLAVVLFADVWPTLGADVGGVLTMVPVFGLLLVALSGRSLSWRQLVLFGAATGAVLAVVATVDLLRPEESRGHLGRFVAGAFGGDGTFAMTLERKWATNMRLFGRTVWTWMVPLTAGVMIYVLVIARGWQRLLPEASALRAGVVAAVGAGVLGWLTNDSGVVVSALVFVFVGPFLTLLALDDGAPGPELLGPELGPEPGAGVRPVPAT